MKNTHLPICGLALLSIFSGCGEEGICEPFDGTYKETTTVTTSDCGELLPVGTVVESVSIIDADEAGDGDPTTDCYETSGPGYDESACTLDGSVTCDHYDDQGFYLFTRKLETHFDLTPSGDYTGTAQITISDVDTGHVCSAVIDIIGDLL